MAYLLPATASVRNRKLGQFMPKQRYRPGLLEGSYAKKRGRMLLGQAPYGPPTIEETPDWLRQAGLLPRFPFAGPLPTCMCVREPCNCAIPSVPPAGQGSGSPTDQAYRDLLTSAQQSTDPLDYVSPQAAIAAGLDAQKVYNVWALALTQQIASGKIKSQQDAIAQGWAPGVVTELWTQAAAAAAAGKVTASWLDQAPLGIANKWLLAGGAGIFLLTGMRGRR